MNNRAMAILTALTALPFNKLSVSPGLVFTHASLPGLAVALSTPRADGTVRAGWISPGNTLEVCSVFVEGITPHKDQSIGQGILARYNATLFPTRNH